MMADDMGFTRQGHTQQLVLQDCLKSLPHVGHGQGFPCFFHGQRSQHPNELQAAI